MSTSTLVIHDDLVQRSPEWYDVRRGIVTASAMATLIDVRPPDATTIACPKCNAASYEPCVSLAASKKPTAIKSIHPERTARASGMAPVYAPATGDTAKGLLATLAAERVAGAVEETATTRDMNRGILAEPFARDTYVKHYGPVRECGFMVRDFGGFRLGYSPDGLVGDDGLIEIKAPRQKGHFNTIVSGQIPAHHMAQLQTGLLVSGRQWIDFVSFNGGMHLWVQRVTPDPKWQAAIHAAALYAEKAIDELTDAYLEQSEGLHMTERIDLFQEIF